MNLSKSISADINNSVCHTEECKIDHSPEYNAVVALYRDKFGGSPVAVKLEEAGSDRKYFRIHAPGRPVVIGTWGENICENQSFIGLAKSFALKGLPVPLIYAVSDDSSSYLQEDLGDESLLKHLCGPERMDLAEESLRQLVVMQTVDEKEWSHYVMVPEFSKRQVMWDLNYFKYDFLKPSGLLFDEDSLENDFETLAATLTSFPESLSGFMYRDFQSRNIMKTEKGVRFIDFQGGRKGPVLYDAISFLWQVKAAFTKDEKNILLGKYASFLSKERNIDPSVVLDNVGVFVLFRTLQVLGAYGFRGLVEKRSHFIESLPGAICNLGELVSDGVVDAYPELKSVAEKALNSRFYENEKPDKLTVKVFSFSYKKGYPEDLSGNGGGFMFDCRGMHNPGRYEEYKSLTGLDGEVKLFLEERGEVQTFVENALRMVTPSICRYHERGFKNLQIGFGCTGGRHRSVYCAQSIAEKIASNFPEVKVELIHREQGFYKTYNQ